MWIIYYCSKLFFLSWLWSFPPIILYIQTILSPSFIYQSPTHSLKLSLHVSFSLRPSLIILAAGSFPVILIYIWPLDLHGSRGESEAGWLCIALPHLKQFTYKSWHHLPDILVLFKKKGQKAFWEMRWWSKQQITFTVPYWPLKTQKISPQENAWNSWTSTKMWCKDVF